MLSRTTVREHSGSFQSIPSNSPAGLLCLQILLEQDESMSPSAAVLDLLIANDFTDLENGLQRSHSRSDMISSALNRPARYARYQTVLSRAVCIAHQDKSQSVMFEGDRFVVLRGDTDWIRIAMSGRIEVRLTSSKGVSALTKSAKPCGGEISHRTVTLDLSAFWKRKSEVEAMYTKQQQQRLDPPSTAHTPDFVHQPGEYEYRQAHLELPGRVPEDTLHGISAENLTAQMKDYSLYDSQPSNYNSLDRGRSIYSHSHVHSQSSVKAPSPESRHNITPSSYPSDYHTSTSNVVDTTKLNPEIYLTTDPATQARVNY